MPKVANTRKVLLFCTIFIILFFLTGCTNNKKDDKELKMEKIDKELGLLDNKIITIINNLNNISYDNYKVIAEEETENLEEPQNEGSETNSSKNDSSGDNEKSNEKDKSSTSEQSGKIFKMEEQSILLDNDAEIKWEENLKNIENIYAIWPTILLDLKSLNINNEDLLAFNNILDEIAINLKSKDKQSSVKNLVRLYSLIPIYKDMYSSDKLQKKIEKTKWNILNVYAVVEDDNWQQAEYYANEAILTFSDINNDKDIYKNNELNINRSSILLENLKTNTNRKDKQIFRITYKNLMQELNLIQ